MPQSRRIFLLAVLIALFGTAALATPPGKPDLSGRWVFNAIKSQLGPTPAPKSRVDQITQKGEHIKLVRTQVDQAGKNYVLNLDCTIGGASCASDYTDPTVKMAVKAKWDGDVLVFTMTVTSNVGEGTVDDRYVRSADGKTLTIKRHVTMAMGGIDQTIVMDKQ